MKNSINNSNLIEKDAKDGKTDKPSFSYGDKRIEWVVASEVAGHAGFPTSDRWTRDQLKDLATDKPHLSRKRKGTKAFEYHVSLLPKETQESLLGGHVIEEPASKYEQNVLPISQGDFLAEFALIPGYSIQVSAGNGALNIDQLEPSRYLAFRRKWLKFRGFAEKDLVIVWAKGDSMESTINNNDTLVVHTGRNRPQDGHIYIFRHDDELFVKRYQSIVGAWRLISDNAMYAPLEIKKEEQHQFEVIGQVVHIAKDIGD
ncbi:MULTISPECIES: helix-turn-helix domain-containing protein [Marinomonas]|uniref:S24 family peptidase n=1 Tax=Marinomonas rhodophyticola TaxID=2992803 RepID=A0ABT3KDQ6_9GAMM|nr:S24 family peptidase [Marinomonas sp. KJ51-3]MCW4628247.1 S24 family peptidase [Marinomonas sp. KJ51-3]